MVGSQMVVRVGEVSAHYPGLSLPPYARAAHRYFGALHVSVCLLCCISTALRVVPQTTCCFMQRSADTPFDAHAGAPLPASPRTRVGSG